MHAQPEGRHEVILYTRAGCGLCEEAKEALAAARLELAFAYREIDIDSDPELFARHRYDIPVVEVDGKRAFKYRVHPAALREKLLG